MALTRIQRFAIAGAIYVVAVTIHLLAIQLFGPDSALRAMNQGAALGGTTAAEVNSQYYRIAVQWVPLGLVGFITAWLVLSEFRTQTVGNIIQQ